MQEGTRALPCCLPHRAIRGGAWGSEPSHRLRDAGDQTKGLHGLGRKPSICQLNIVARLDRVSDRRNGACRALGDYRIEKRRRRLGPRGSCRPMRATYSLKSYFDISRCMTRHRCSGYASSSPSDFKMTHYPGSADLDEIFDGCKSLLGNHLSVGEVGHTSIGPALDNGARPSACKLRKLSQCLKVRCVQVEPLC